MARYLGDRLPTSVLEALRLGDAPEGQCVWLATADRDGTPRPCLLSVGEMAAVDDRTLRVLTWPASRTTANLVTGATVLLTLAVPPDVFHVRAVPARLDPAPGCDLARFALTVASVEVDGHDGLPVTRTMWFAARPDLAESTMDMWRAQHRALRY